MRWTTDLINPSARRRSNQGVQDARVLKLVAIALVVALARGLRQLDTHPVVVARGQPGGPGRRLAPANDIRLPRPW
jgi:hypothetical protein